MGRYTSSKENFTRRVECVFFFLVVFLTISGSISLIKWRRMIPSTVPGCGPSFSEFGVILNDAVAESDGSYSSLQLGLKFPPGKFWKDNNLVYGCPCSLKYCIRKCCPEREEYKNISGNFVCNKSESYIPFQPLKREVYFNLKPNDLREKHSKDISFFVLYGYVCKYGSYETDGNDRLMEDGRIIITGGHILDQSQYCLESSGDGNIYTVECQSDDSHEDELNAEVDNFKSKLFAICMVVSEPFLLITYVAYALVPQKNNLHRKWLFSHVTTLFFTYGALAYIKTVKDPSKISCYISAFIAQYFWLACCFWLNAMSFDIWGTFSGRRLLRGSKGDTEHKKLLLYSVYAWGMSLAVTATTLAMDLIPGIPDNYIKPGIFSVDQCWFNGEESSIVYLYLPMGILVSLNMLMFSATAWRIRKQDRYFKGLKSDDSKRHNVNKKRFNIYLKLFVVMGITWLLEIASFLLRGSPYIWIASDVCNSLQGPLIFFLFVCNRNTLYSLNMKLCPTLKIVKPPLQKRNNTMTSRLSVSTYSSVKINDPHPL